MKCYVLEHLHSRILCLRRVPDNIILLCNVLELEIVKPMRLKLFHYIWVILKNVFRFTEKNHVNFCLVKVRNLCIISKRPEKSIHITWSFFPKKCNQNTGLVSVSDINPRDCITLAPMDNLNYEYLNI